MRTTVRQAGGLAGAAALLAAIALLAACGGGGGAAPSSLHVDSTALPMGVVGFPYSAALKAAGGEEPYAWALAAGQALPSGLALTAEGVLSGTPLAAGAWAFALLVRDASLPSPRESTIHFTLTVSTTRLNVLDLRFGEAWTGGTYAVVVAGTPQATVALVQSGSGGTLVPTGPTTASYVAGTQPGTDRLRATMSNGATEDLSVTVRADPAAAMTGRFSTTDVWRVRFSGRRDASHPYASDWHAALVRMGLRAPTSTGPTGTLADDLADACARIEILRAMNAVYGNARGGAALPGGLAISFPFEEPGPAYRAAADGEFLTPRANQFSVISVHSGTQEGVLGTAFMDNERNSVQENNTTSKDAGELGIFVDELVPYFNDGYSNWALTANCVGAGDVAALRAVLYELPSPGGRYVEIARIVRGLGQTLGYIVGHEMAHSLGLDHTTPAVPGSLMNGAVSIGPSTSLAFLPSDWGILEDGLPGPGRGGSPLRAADGDEGRPPGVIIVCGFER